MSSPLLLPDENAECRITWLEGNSENWGWERLTNFHKIPELAGDHFIIKNALCKIKKNVLCMILKQNHLLNTQFNAKSNCKDMGNQNWIFFLIMKSPFWIHCFELLCPTSITFLNPNPFHSKSFLSPRKSLHMAHSLDQFSKDFAS